MKAVDNLTYLRSAIFIALGILATGTKYGYIGVSIFIIN